MFLERHFALFGLTVSFPLCTPYILSSPLRVCPSFIFHWALSSGSIACQFMVGVYFTERFSIAIANATTATTLLLRCWILRTYWKIMFKVGISIVVPWLWMCDKYVCACDQFTGFRPLPIILIFFHFFFISVVRSFANYTELITNSEERNDNSQTSK